MYLLNVTLQIKVLISGESTDAVLHRRWSSGCHTLMVFAITVSNEIIFHKKAPLQSASFVTAPVTMVTRPFSERVC